MNLFARTALLAAPLLFAATALAGVRVTEGSVEGITQYKRVKVVYVYDGMTVGSSKTEDEYVTERVDEKNAKKPGDGDRWQKAWYADREKRFQPKFEELVNKYMQKAEVRLSPAESSPDLIMTVQVTRLEPGFYAYVAKSPAKLDLVVTMAKADSPESPIATLEVFDAPGSPYPDVGSRVSEAFAKAGKDLGKFLKKRGV